MAKGSPYISASRSKLKKRLDDPESNLLRGFQLKFEPIRHSGLGCRGGGGLAISSAAHLVFRALLICEKTDEPTERNLGPTENRPHLKEH